MVKPTGSVAYSITFDDVSGFIIKATPRVVVATFVGYYSLGIAYETGLMARLDVIAIRVFKHFFGYAGVGAFMPTFQWYAAWSVRFSAAAVGAFVYDISERIAIALYRLIIRILGYVATKALTVFPFLQTTPPIAASN